MHNGNTKESSFYTIVVEINEGRIPVSSDRTVLGDEKRESTNVRFTTGTNSAAPNANLYEKS